MAIVTRPALGLLALLACPAAVLSGQHTSQPGTLVSFSAGLASGPVLWHITQPLCLWGTVPGGYQCSVNGSGLVEDTLSLTRRVSVGPTLGVGITRFVGARVAWRLDFTYASLAIDDRCAPAAPYQDDPDAKNRQTCENFTADNASLSFLSVSGGLFVRAFPAAALTPFVRLGGGLTLKSGETLAAAGAFSASGETLTRQMVTDSSDLSVEPFAAFAVGLELGTQSATRFQLEVQDVAVPLARLTGPGDIEGRAPSSTKLIQTFSLTLGVALVPGGSHRRRY